MEFNTMMDADAATTGPSSRYDNVPLSAVKLPTRVKLRASQPAVVLELAESIKTRGLLNPITVLPLENGGYELIAGRHRLDACRALQYQTIPACIVTGIDAIESELAEIDENLIRAELSPAERAAHHARRKELYEQKHPATRQGGAPAAKGSAKGGKVAKLASLPRYTADTAAKVGQAERTVQRDITRGAAIPNVAALARTSLDSGEELDALAKLGKQAPKRQTALIERAKEGEKVSAKTELKRAVREEREVALADKTKAASAALDGTKLYGVIYADPEWRFEPYSRETGMDRAADNHYQTSGTDVIAARKVPAAKDCVLFLWATAPMIEHALRVMRAWGFEYKSQCVWKKHKAGTGYWFRNWHEVLLVGTRGSIPAPAPGQQFPSVIEADAGEHSAKPNHFADMIEELFPNVPKLEMNARKPRLGWDVWGNEANG